MAISVKNLSKSYGENKVLNDFSKVFEDNSFTCIMGKSGGGKTTLLNVILGVTKQDAGEICVTENARFSAVFQENRLCENLTALLNVKMVTDISGRYSRSDIINMFKRIGIDGEDKKPVSDFSGGMKRRVAILRALMADFDILVMDEPLKGLDEETKGSVVELIRELTEGKIVIMTTHDLTEPKLFDAEIIQI